MRQSLPADRLLHPLGYTTPLGRRDWTVSRGLARRVGRLDRRQAPELAALVAAGRPLAGASRPLALEALAVLEALELLELLELLAVLAEGAQNHLDGIR